MSRKVILDTETTGLHPTEHRLTEIGCFEMFNRRLTGKKFHTYLNPEREIDKGAENMTGLTYEFLKDKPKFIDIVDDLVLFLQEEDTELIIHNAPFDVGFLNQEFNRIKHPWYRLEERVAIMDTLVLARQLHPGQKNNLDALCKRYNVDNSHREYHGALLDAEILAKVYLAMTAGQTSLSLEGEVPQNRPQQTKLRVKKVSRRLGEPLVVIKANEEELKAHEARLAELS